MASGISIALPDFRLRIVGARAANPVASELESSILDDRIAPKGYVRCDIRIASRKNDSKRAVLDNFIVQSIISFVNNQSSICQALQEELKRMREDVTGQGSNDAVWREIEDIKVAFQSRNVPSDQALQRLQETVFQDEELHEIAKNFDLPSTNSSFSLLFDAQWEPDHQVLATFRDSKLVDLTIT